MNALEDQAYDVLTIAAVADDAELVSLALELGNRPDLVTSPYEGTALIAAAHLGHHEVVRRLLRAGAPMDHVNNLGWTALMEAVVLGDGGPDHVGTMKPCWMLERTPASPTGMASRRSNTRRRKGSSRSLHC